MDFFTLFIFLAKELLNIEVDIIFFVFLLDNVELFAEFYSFFSVTLSERISAKCP
jgi:hypothetical protein